MSISRDPFHVSPFHYNRNDNISKHLNKVMELSHLRVSKSIFFFFRSAVRMLYYFSLSRSQLLIMQSSSCNLDLV